MPDHDLTADPLAAALARLRPAPAAAEKPAFLFRAGQASRDGVVRRWKTAALLAGVAVVGSWAYGFVRYSELQDRAATAEARAQELAGLLAEPPAPPPSAPAPAHPAIVVPAAMPTPAPLPYYRPDPTPDELADALRQRNEILTAGLTLLPPTPAPTRPTGDFRHPLPGGVFAAPRVDPPKQSRSSRTMRTSNRLIRRVRSGSER